MMITTLWDPSTHTHAALWEGTYWSCHTFGCSLPSHHIWQLLTAKPHTHTCCSLSPWPGLNPRTWQPFDPLPPPPPAGSLGDLLRIRSRTAGWREFFLSGDVTWLVFLFVHHLQLVKMWPVVRNVWWITERNTWMNFRWLFANRGFFSLHLSYIHAAHSDVEEPYSISTHSALSDPPLHSFTPAHVFQQQLVACIRPRPHPCCRGVSLWAYGPRWE